MRQDTESEGMSGLQHVMNCGCGALLSRLVMRRCLEGMWEEREMGGTCPRKKKRSVHLIALGYL